METTPTKTATVKDQNSHIHKVKCDFIKVDGDNVLLMKDERTETSNKCLVVAVFYKPIHCVLG